MNDVEELDTILNNVQFVVLNLSNTVLGKRCIK